MIRVSIDGPCKSNGNTKLIVRIKITLRLVITSRISIRSTIDEQQLFNCLPYKQSIPIGSNRYRSFPALDDDVPLFLLLSRTSDVLIEHSEHLQICGLRLVRSDLLRSGFRGAAVRF